MQRKIIAQYYILSGIMNFGGLSLISATYVDFLMRNGMDLMHVNLVNTAFYITIFMAEIPTGAFADIFGRKLSFIMSAALLALASLVYGCSSTFIWFVIAEVIAGIALTFESGAFDAWMVDSLKYSGYRGSFTRIFALRGLINQICGAVGAIIGSYFMSIKMSLPWHSGSVVMSLVAILAFIIMKEEYFVRGTMSWKRGLKNMKDIVIKSANYGINHKAVRFILIITFVQILAVQPLNMYWQPFFKTYGLHEMHFGWLFAFMMGALAVGTSLAATIKQRHNEKRFIVITQIATGILIIAVIWVSSLPAVLIIFVLHEIPRGLWKPLQSSYLQERIPSKERATIVSFTAIAPHVGGCIGLVISGFIAQKFGIATTWFITGIILIMGGLLVAKNGHASSP